MIALAVWLAGLPFRLLVGLGLRRSVILACLLVLAVTGYGVAEDLGLLDPPASAKQKPARQAPPSSAAKRDVPAGYLRLYQQATRRSTFSNPELAGFPV